ncbi:hypothetical protein BDW59DRAFT_165823 [Aspergillus cavernicola]|uniref:EF-hand domain-containing protein n=1 Tax=Aspergillus cavernicola TaxID=176166 RepID=A0ABR4HQ93_9EURO
MFDRDGSGTINFEEFVSLWRYLAAWRELFDRFDEDRSGRQSTGMSFDLFVQACISLKRMTDVFKRYDEDRDGYITLSFEEALTEILLLQE